MNKKKNEKCIINLKKFSVKKPKDFNIVSNKGFSNILSSSNDQKHLPIKKKSLLIDTNNIKLFNQYFINSPKLKKIKTTYFSEENNKKEVKKLSKNEKMKLKSIIKKFTKYKLATEYLFDKEKNMLLNSVNTSNFNFLFSEEENNKKNKKQKKKKNISNFVSYSMINKFNNKTSSILDNPFQNHKFSKNIKSFRKQIINSFTNQDRNMENAFYSKQVYQDALDIFDENEDEKINKILKDEEKFYKLKAKEMGFYEIDLKKAEENNKSDNIKRGNSFQNIKSLYFNFSKKKDDVPHTKQNPLSSKNISVNFKINSSKNLLKNLGDKTKSSNNNKESNKNNNQLNIKNLTTMKYINNYNDRMIKFKPNFINKNNSNYNNNIYNKNEQFKSKYIFNKKKEKLLRIILKKFWRHQKQKVIDKSKRLANSMSQMNFFHYKPKGYADYKNSTLNINSENLTRIRKLIQINKYLCDVEDDDLLVMDTKKLRSLMKQAEMQYYLINKKDFQLSYLRKNLKPQTISKFCRIKNSFFGLPC